MEKIKKMLSKVLKPSLAGAAKVGILTAVITVMIVGIHITISNSGQQLSTNDDYYSSTLTNPFPSLSFALVRVNAHVMLDSCQAATAEGGEFCQSLINRTRDTVIDVPNMRSVGSGSVIGHSENRTFVLTAKHVCDGAVPEFDVQVGHTPDGSLVILTVRGLSTFELEDVSGNKHEARIFRVHQTSDICVLETQGNWGVPIRVANEHPPEGAMIYNIAAPRGIFSPGMVPRWRGYYSGTNEGYNFYSVPVAGGSSGSPVLYNDEIISIIVMAPRGFSNIAIGVSLQDLHEVVGSIQTL